MFFFTNCHLKVPSRLEGLLYNQGTDWFQYHTAPDNNADTADFYGSMGA